MTYINECFLRVKYNVKIFQSLFVCSLSKSRFSFDFSIVRSSFNTREKPLSTPALNH